MAILDAMAIVTGIVGIVAGKMLNKRLLISYMILGIICALVFWAATVSPTYHFGRTPCYAHGNYGRCNNEHGAYCCAACDPGTCGGAGCMWQEPYTTGRCEVPRFMREFNVPRSGLQVVSDRPSLLEAINLRNACEEIAETNGCVAICNTALAHVPRDWAANYTCVGPVRPCDKDCCDALKDAAVVNPALNPKPSRTNCDSPPCDWFNWKRVAREATCATGTDGKALSSAHGLGTCETDDDVTSKDECTVSSTEVLVRLSSTEVYTTYWYSNNGTVLSAGATYTNNGCHAENLDTGALCEHKIFIWITMFVTLGLSIAGSVMGCCVVCCKNDQLSGGDDSG